MNNVDSAATQNDKQGLKIHSMFHPSLVSSEAKIYRRMQSRRFRITVIVQEKQKTVRAIVVAIV